MNELRQIGGTKGSRIISTFPTKIVDVQLRGQLKAITAPSNLFKNEKKPTTLQIKNITISL